MTICGLQGLNVTSSAFAHTGQILLAPAEALPSEKMNQDNISHQPGMPAITVGKRVDCNQAMMESGHYFIGRVGLEFQPALNVLKELMQRNRDLLPLDANVLLTAPGLPGPAPNMPKHPLVQVPHILFGQDVPLFAPKNCVFSLGNILLLPTVQFCPRSDVWQQEPLGLIGIDGSGPFGIIKNHYNSLQKSLGSSRIKSSILSSSIF